MQKSTITPLQAFYAMQQLLENYFENTSSHNIKKLLEDINKVESQSKPAFVLNLLKDESRKIN
jgi:hypothetical protein